MRLRCLLVRLRAPCHRQPPPKRRIQARYDLFAPCQAVRVPGAHPVPSGCLYGRLRAKESEAAATAGTWSVAVRQPAKTAPHPPGGGSGNCFECESDVPITIYYFVL